MYVYSAKHIFPKNTQFSNQFIEHHKLTFIKDSSDKLQFLFSGHIPCKENIVIVKKFDFEILTYLCIFRSP